MDVNGIAAVASNLSQAQTADAVQVAVLRKAMDVQAQGALALLEAVPTPPQVNNPPHLGQQVDVFA